MPPCRVIDGAIARPQLADQRWPLVADLNLRTAVALGSKAHIHAGRLFGAAAQIPVIGQVVRWIPGDYLAPGIFDTFWRALIQPVARMALQQDRRAGIAAARVT